MIAPDNRLEFLEDMMESLHEDLGNMCDMAAVLRADMGESEHANRLDELCCDLSEVYTYVRDSLRDLGPVLPLGITVQDVVAVYGRNAPMVLHRLNPTAFPDPATLGGAQ